MLQETLVLFKNIRQPAYKGSLEEYENNGGYQTCKKVLKEMQPAAALEKIMKSGLRGRGGAGFPTGMKWSFMAKNTGKPSYLVCNADEGEPGTFKDREIMLKDPHLFLEGMILGCFVVGCNQGYIYVRGEYFEAIETLEREIKRLEEKKYLGEKIFGSPFGLKLIVHPGAGAYICGEETALLDSLEGKRGLPRVKPPFPAVSGFNESPTSVNNVETLSNLPFILNAGPEAFCALGSPNNAGTHIVGLSGHVKNPGAYEVKMGENLKTIIEDLGGGTSSGKKIKAVIPGGSSSPILTAQEIDVAYDFDSLAKIGTMMGSAGVIILDETVSIPKLLLRVISFYAHESCGQCTPCREGMNWLRINLRELLEGKHPSSWIDQIVRIAKNIMGNTLCPFGDAGAMPVISYIQKFRPEFEAFCKK